MKSIDFNGATASSLLLLSKDEIDIIMNATRRRIDSIQAEDMMNCLIYMKELLNTAKFSNNTIAKEFLTGIASICSSRKTYQVTETETDSYEDDLFGELVETDVFSGLEETGSSLEATSLFSLETIDEKSFEKIVDMGSAFFDDEVDNLILDLIEINKYFTALDVRIKVKNRSILELADEGTIRINPENNAWRNKEQLLDALNTGRISIYDLSIDECKAVLDIIESDSTLKSFIYNQQEVKKTKEEILSEKIITTLKEKSQEMCGEEIKIQYLIRQFLYKSNKVGKIEYKLLGIPLNRVDIALSGKYFVSKCESINNYLKKNNYRQNVIRNFLVQTEKIKELITHSSYVECNEEELYALITLKDHLATEGMFTDVEYNEDELALMKEFLRKLNAKGLLIASHSTQEDYEPNPVEKEEDESRNYTLYNEYQLYKLKTLFSLNKLSDALGEDISDFATFLKINNLLVSNFKMIPLTLPEIHEKGLLRSIDDGARVSYSKYEKILPNLTLLQRNLESLDYRQSNTCRIIIE